MFQKTKSKKKKYFCKSCLQCFSSKNVLNNHKKVSLKINSEQAVKLEKGTIQFENYFQQIPVPFKALLILSVLYCNRFSKANKQITST